jgi:hypothetical protein
VGTAAAAASSSSSSSSSSYRPAALTAAGVGTAAAASVSLAAVPRYFNSSLTQHFPAQAVVAAAEFKRSRDHARAQEEQLQPQQQAQALGRQHTSGMGTGAHALPRGGGMMRGRSAQGGSMSALRGGGRCRLRRTRSTVPAGTGAMTRFGRGRSARRGRGRCAGLSRATVMIKSGGRTKQKLPTFRQKALRQKPLDGRL